MPARIIESSLRPAVTMATRLSAPITHKPWLPVELVLMVVVRAWRGFSATMETPGIGGMGASKLVARAGVTLNAIVAMLYLADMWMPGPVLRLSERVARDLAVVVFRGSVKRLGSTTAPVVGSGPSLLVGRPLNNVFCHD